MPAAFSLASPSFILLVSLVASTCALVIPSPQILSVAGDKRQDGYIVKFRDGVDHPSTMDWFKQNFGLTEANVEHEYPPSVRHGFRFREIGVNITHRFSTDFRVDSMQQLLKR